MANNRLQCEGNQCFCKDNESGRMRFRNYEDGTSDGGFLTGSVSDNGSRIKCGTTERGCGTTKRGDSESGRSMVEMLGTLAIMGVLAIGGVAGYRWAMDKYKANDILNEVRKRAVVASQQKIRGQSINLTEYGEQKIQGYALNVIERYNNHPDFFALELVGVSDAVCDKLIDEKPAQALHILVNDQTVTACPDKATLTFAFANTLDGAATSPAEATKCQTGADCTDEAAPVCSPYGYCEPCPEGQYWEDNACKSCPNETPVWNGSACVECTDDSHCVENKNGKVCNISEQCTECADNGDCQELYGNNEYYCAVTADYVGSNKGDSGTCYTKYKGECKPKGSKPSATPVTVDGETEPFMTIYKGGKMTWWSAANWCESHGLELFRLHDESGNHKLDCAVDVGKDGSIQGGYCNIDGLDKNGTLTKKTQALQTILSGTYWVRETYLRTCDLIIGCRACSSFSVNLDGWIYHSNGLNGINGLQFTLCE